MATSPFNLDKVSQADLERTLPVTKDSKGRLVLNGRVVYRMGDAPEQGWRVRKGAKACGFYLGEPVFHAWDFSDRNIFWDKDCASEWDLY